MKPVPDTGPIDDSAAVYSPLTLALYDAWVLQISNRFAWRCPTRTALLPFYERHLGRKHLDVGVGTGYYLAHCKGANRSSITLMDINVASLQAASRRIRALKPQTIVHNVFTPLETTERYGSISLFYLMHCLSGSVDEKAQVFSHLKACLAPGGTLYGATILGQGVAHNRFGRKLMDVYNAKGIFGNRNDSAEAFIRVLNGLFGSVQAHVVGCVLLFAAQDAPRPCANASESSAGV